MDGPFFFFLGAGYAMGTTGLLGLRQVSWKDGFLVTAAPFIYLIEDTDEDGKADHKEIIFSGFFEELAWSDPVELLPC